MEMIILTSIICTLFITFIFGPLLYAHKQVKKKSKKIVTNVKKIKKIVRTISDMESDGIYFSQEVKDELKKQREELLCHYSGLPSLKSYQKNNQE
jgi:hypothetical protein